MKEGEEVKTDWLETAAFSRVFADILSIANDLIGDETFYISLVERDRLKVLQTLSKSDILVQAGKTVRLQDTYCQIPYASGQPMLIKNAKEDERTKRHDFTYSLNIGSYAGVPISLGDGSTFGALCSIHTSLNRYDNKTVQILKKLASFLSYAIDTERLLIQDGLTGLYNRVYWKRVLTSDWIEKETHALLMIDLDKFKQVNDRFGHEAGDHVLIEVASVIKQIIPDDAYGFRFGGDEFGVLFLHRSAEEASLFAQEIIDESKRNQELRTYGVLLSAGIADTKRVPVQSLMKEADGLLYQSKRNGGCRVSI
ncbi:sensor domain-containing diguanylate cyclase [Domibacillus indicus]|uniref:sensor domain-containing diguanylate cyclase n=1 Tax=Domibacillus indicus TaxID=1437523 RepID=UPI00203E1F2A|nr:sensor domain-containing diguanylate cyclase [Domibacillus indicus]MCM3789149.1 sensor domain-containing diguanylate cyclase [Domibacillus indicus]